MPIHIQWYDENHTIILYIIQGQWTPSDILDVLREGQQLTAADQPPFYHLVDMTESGRIPLGLMGLYDEVSDILRDTEEMTIFVGAHPFFRIIANTFIRIVRTMNFKFVDHMDEAIAIIAAQQEPEIC